MFEFTAEQLANIANSILDFNIKGKAVDQIKQARPFYDRMVKGQKTFPGGKELITGPVRGEYQTTLMGFSGDDEVSFGNPSTTKRWSTNWYELHAGIKATLTELKHAGISVVDSNRSETTKNHSGQGLIQLTNILDEKFYDMEEGSTVDFAKMLLRDGTQDPLKPAGITSILSLSPSTGVTFGLDRALNPFWRNRAISNLSTTTPSDMAISRAMQNEIRQLKRYKPGAKLYGYMGSDFLEAWENEFRAKGSMTMTGWQGKQDPSVGDVAFKGVDGFIYDPLMDDEGMDDEMLLVDHSAINLWVMEGEDWKMHTPSRPPEKYVLYRAKTWTGGIGADQLNSSGRYKLA